MPRHLWSDLTTRDLAGAAWSDAVAVLPVGAIEQHGPHMPLGTDQILAEAFANSAAEKACAQIVVLPVQSYGASEEHHDWPGTIWLSPERLVDILVSIGRGIAAAGIQRLVLINAHGGNVPALHIACRRLRVSHNLFAASLGWMALGLPPVPEDTPDNARTDDIHAGYMETSVMLHLRPELVDMTKAQNFVPSSRAVADANQYLRVTGAINTGWTARDLHVSGAIGNAAAATAQAGGDMFAHCTDALAGFLDEVAGHDPAFLQPGTSRP